MYKVKNFFSGLFTSSRREEYLDAVAVATELHDEVVALRKKLARLQSTSCTCKVKKSAIKKVAGTK